MGSETLGNRISPAGDLRRTARAAIDLLLPRECPVCGRVLGAAESHLCLGCEADIPLTGYSLRAHNPMADRFNETLESYRQDDESMPYEWADALMFYDAESPYTEIPKALKYHGDTALGRYFGAMLGERISSAPRFRDVDLVIPVPLHWTRMWSRGYNQAMVLAEEISAELGCPLGDGILIRSRRTRTQTRLSVSGKADNVRGAFSVRGALPSGTRHVLLVDDTFTTGATLAACHNALRRIQDPPERISIATLAVVPTRLASHSALQGR